jgi:hypothetical protein
LIENVVAVSLFEAMRQGDLRNAYADQQARMLAYARQGLHLLETGIELEARQSGCKPNS